MELRAEPRFGTHSRAVLEVVRDKVHTYDTTITEVSGTGLRIEMAEELAVGETIRLLINNHHLFAQVRRCVPAESGFIIGIERIDDWNGSPTEISLENSTTSPVKVLGRPTLKNPLGSLRAPALRALFTDPRLRTREIKYQAVFIVAGCIALAGWAGFGAGISLHGKPQGATPAKTGAARQLPEVPKSTTDVAPPKAAATSLVASNTSNPPVAVTPMQKAPIVAPPVQKAQVEMPSVQVVAPPVQKAAVTAPPVQKAAAVAPPVQKAVVVAPPKAATQPTIVAASRISIKATDVSWLTACVDGAKVLDTLLVKGYVGQIPFSRQATLRFGNAGAIELAVGNQPPAKLGSLGEVRTVKISPSGYEPITLSSALNCNIH